jgi:hypothetical protein
MIEKINLQDNQEVYTFTNGSNDVAVILCLTGRISVRNYSNLSEVYAILNPDESWTLTGSSIRPAIKSEEATGSSFLIVHYYRQ